MGGGRLLAGVPVGGEGDSFRWGPLARRGAVLGAPGDGGAAPGGRQVARGEAPSRGGGAEGGARSGGQGGGWAPQAPQAQNTRRKPSIMI
eukprot:489642-Prorocentrum_minimum.AAC.1